MDLIRDGKASLKDAQDALYRDDPEMVARLHQTVTESPWGHSRLAMGDYGLLEELPLLSDPEGLSGKRLRHDDKAPLRPQAQRKERGVIVKEMASDVSLWGDGDLSPDCAVMPDREALCRLLQENCWLKRAPFGREQSRWFVTDTAVEGGYGQTVDPSNIHSLKISGGKKSFPFPVFYEDKVRDVIWTLGWDIILNTVSALKDKKARLAWLLTHHSYLPNKTLADLSGMGIATVERRRRENDG
ncbi:hypothetical protein GRO01_21800 [Gluconobacter roseus NBRC 3990]|uniref:Uncharacterized protein n=2 Tax=Gluconobacter roseus TaxID=586239 RepID=A0A4Y3M7D6_9PROT|nr:hypothetical protein AA3990_1738 [Gluconobacter roseus NBRC 3990]GEB04604.1 hypothetical protein GRO01_21800 [Gluconobacter roseus NBRC 3990]GLP92261.1 hypothetical protein GCM10007871_02390 [Gluconobacter roseus NBRC 3990]